MNVLTRDAKLKWLSIAAGLLATCCLAVSLNAGHEVITCKSPDRKFALRCVYADKQPYYGEVAIVDLETHKNVFSLDPNWTFSQVKLVWSPDAQRFAYFFEKGHNRSTRVFFRNGDTFNEIALPELPTPNLPKNATGSEPDTQKRVEPIEWTRSDELLLEKELINPNWGRGAAKITLGFDQSNSPAIRKTEPEKVSIIDYFLLLPAENFEGPPSIWLRQMRGADPFPCDRKPEHNIDEKNGYMSCGGDGAQSSFDVALFRYRDGRPLLALCQAGEPEVEEENSVYSYLSFFELGADGKMHEIEHSMLPRAVKGNWEFVLPRQGRTILVRAPKSKKILHKFTWDGEKFQEEK
jgi:hypothetical protein